MEDNSERGRMVALLHRFEWFPVPGLLSRVCRTCGGYERSFTTPAEQRGEVLKPEERFEAGHRPGCRFAALLR